MTPDTDEYYNRQHYELAGENQRGARCAACCDALRRRYPVTQGAGRWLVAVIASI